MHKTLTTDEMFSICEPTPEQLAVGSKKIYDLLGKECRPDWLNYGVKEGWYNVATIVCGGEPSFVIWHHLDAQGGLIINAAASICHVPRLPALVAAIESIAKQKRAKYIAFNTTRSGLAKTILQFGFEPHSVTFQKTLV